MKRVHPIVTNVIAVCLLANLGALAHAGETSVQSRTTIWVGTENLQGYGRLEFQFSDGGRVLMIDARENSNGSFTRNGSSITLTFPGRAVYYGTINGNSMSGTARDSTRTWSWSVGFRQNR
ncbi:MAG: hypothetical protein HYX68_09815 [Planctomycetes bacterium]|jgi:hypothetical protein|nr:hypothetical protein [Planctomycetota bacterium]